MDNDKIKLLLQNLQSEDLQTPSLNMIIDMIRGPDNTLNFHRWVEDRKALEDVYRSRSIGGDSKRLLADILSVLYVCSDGHHALSYRLVGGAVGLDCWGIAYVRRLCTEIISVYGNRKGCAEEISTGGSLDKRKDDGKDVLAKTISLPEDVRNLALECVRFLVDHNAECDAVDFLLELHMVGEIAAYVQEHNYRRVILYLEGIAKFFDVLDVIAAIHAKMGSSISLILTLIRAGRADDAVAVFAGLSGGLKKQAAFVLSRFNIVIDDAETQDIFLRAYLSPFFVHVRADMEIESFQNMEAEVRAFLPALDIDTKTSQFTSIGTGLVNYGTENQVIFSDLSDRSEFVAVFAANGLLSAFNSEKCLDELNDAVFGTDVYRKTGSLLGYAISSAQTVDPGETALALLAENLETKCVYAKMATILGIQLIYTGTRNERVRDILVETASSESIEVCGLSLYALGSVFIGTGDPRISELMLAILKNFATEEGTPFYKMMALGLALLFFKNTATGEVLSALRGMKNSGAKYSEVLVSGMSKVESGDVEFVEELVTTVFTIAGNESNGVEVNQEVGEGKDGMCEDKKGMGEGKDGMGEGKDKNSERINKNQNEDKMKNDDKKQGEDKERENKKQNKDKESEDKKQNGDENEYQEDDDNFNPDANLEDLMELSRDFDISYLKDIGSDFDLEEYESKTIEAIALLSIALVSLSSTNTRKMCARLINAAACTESDEVKAAIPLCYALLYASNPSPDVVDVLAKGLNAQNPDTVVRNILCLGIVGAGTNSARIADILTAHTKHSIRCQKTGIACAMALALLRLGKGTLSLHPYTYHILNPRMLSGLAALMTLMSDDNVLFNYPFLWYVLTPAINSKVVIAVDTDLNPVNVNVKVGNPVEIVGMTGEQKRLSGVQVFQSPAVVGIGEEAEIDDECFTEIIEGVVVVKK